MAINYTVLSDIEFYNLTKIETPKGRRELWTQEVLALAKAHPSQWIKLEEQESAVDVSRYLKPLKPLGLTTRTVGTVRSREGKSIKFQKGTVFVKWEDKDKY
jgi:hypothetical protein